MNAQENLQQCIYLGNSTQNTLQVNIKLCEVGMSNMPTSLLEKKENNNSRKRNYSKTIFGW